MQKMQRAFVYGMAFALIVAEASAAIGQATPADTPAAPEPPGLTTVVPRLTPTDPPGSLAAAMIQAKPPEGQIAIAIGADRVRLPDSNMPPAGSTVYRLADLFGMLARPFGGVIAIAPSTMTVLNTAPGAPHPFDGMPPADAFKLLVGSLSQTQWQSLTSVQGLGMGDLQSDDQRELFRAIFPESGLHVFPMPALGAVTSISQFKTITPDEAEQAHIRLSRETDMMLSMAEPHSFASLSQDPEPEGSHNYEVMVGPVFTANLDTLYGVRVRAKMPNTPKPGNLDFQEVALKAPVSLSGVKTVEELIERISRATRVELYADRRYEDRKIVITAGARAARAADLLQAIAFCLCGTYRRVGPAFVLTDDLIGVGTRREIIDQLRSAADRARQGLLDQAGDTISQSHSVDDLPARPGSVAMTSGQIQQGLTQEKLTPIGRGPRITVPMEELTPQQQDMAQRIMDVFLRERDRSSKLPDGQGQGAPPPIPNLDGPVMLGTKPTVDLLLPSLDGPVAMGLFLNPQGIFTPSNKLLKERAAAAPKPVPPAARVQPSALADVLKPFPHRAALVQAHTTAEVDSVVSSMQRLGLNELWLEVFDPGVPDVSTRSGPDGGDLLTEAMKITRGTDIRVLPVLRLLKWSANTPLAERDLSVLGEESPAAIARRRLNEPQGLASTDDALDITRAVAVSPFAPSVRDRLTKLMANLAREPGIAGLVWRSPTLPGYSVQNDNLPASFGSELGYTPSARLAFLRASHADPLDIDPNADGEAADALPGFDDFKLDLKLRDEWGQFRVSEDVSLLRTLDAAATVPPARTGQSGAPLQAPGRLPILIEATRPEYDQKIDWNWYGSWDVNGAPLPALRIFGGQPNLAKEAHAGSRTALFCLMPDDRRTPSEVALSLENTTRNAQWDGVVLDLTTPHSGPGRTPTCAEWLAALAK